MDDIYKVKEHDVMDMLNVFFRVAPDPNILFIYNHFLKEQRTYSETIRWAVSSLLERYDPDLGKDTDTDE